MDETLVLFRWTDSAIGITGWGLFFLNFFLFSLYRVGRDKK